MSTVETKPNLIILPWGIVADAPRNNDLLIQSIPGCRLRGAVAAGKPVKDIKSGRMMIPPDQSAYLGQFPNIPGMELHVNPEKLTYMVMDPLCDDEALCETIRAAMDNLGPFRMKQKLKGLEPQRGKLDVHRMKTLMREMIWIVESDYGRVIKGSMPSMELVEQMPGKFLLNPGCSLPNTQPIFEQDLPEWLERLTAAGG